MNGAKIEILSCQSSAISEFKSQVVVYSLRNQGFLGISTVQRSERLLWSMCMGASFQRLSIFLTSDVCGHWYCFQQIGTRSFVRESCIITQQSCFRFFVLRELPLVSRDSCIDTIDTLYAVNTLLFPSLLYFLEYQC